MGSDPVNAGRWLRARMDNLFLQQGLGIPRDLPGLEVPCWSQDRESWLPECWVHVSPGEQSYGQTRRDRACRQVQCSPGRSLGNKAALAPWMGPEPASGTMGCWLFSQGLGPQLNRT